MRFITCLLACLFLPSAYAVDLDAKIATEFSAYAHQALLKTQDSPDFADLRKALADRPLPYKASAEFSTWDWKFAADVPVFEALGIRDLAWQAFGDKDRATAFAEKYLLSQDYKATFAQFINAPFRNREEAYDRGAIETATCNAQYMVINNKSKKAVRVAGDVTISANLVADWQENRKVYSIMAQAPQGDDERTKFHMVVGYWISFTSMISDYDFFDTVEHGTTFYTNKDTKALEPASNDNHTQYRRHGHTADYKALTGGLLDQSTTTAFLPNGQSSAKKIIPGDQGFKLKDVTVTSRVSDCLYSPADFEKADIDPLLRSAIVDFSKKFNEVDELRRKWLTCLGAKSATECAPEEKIYRDGDIARDAFFNNLFTLKNVPFYRLLPEPVPIQLAKDAKPQSKSIAAPFPIPGRQCTYVEVQGHAMAYCDGGMSCSYGDAKSAGCSDGSKCDAKSCH